MWTELHKVVWGSVQGTLRYGFWAPFTAAWRTLLRRGGYARHLKGLYRLAFRSTT